LSTPKPTLTAYSPGDGVGFVVTNSLYNTEVLQQGAWTQLMLGAATAFPPFPNTDDTCFRSNLGAWFRWDGTAWRQMGRAFFATASRPAAPPTDYRYVDLTDGFAYRWNGSAYVADGSTLAGIRSSTTSALLSDILSNGVSGNTYAQLVDAGGGVLTLQAGPTVGGSPGPVAAIINGEMRVNTANVSTTAITIPGSSTRYYLVFDRTGSGPGFTISLQTGTTVTASQSIKGSVIYDTVAGQFVVANGNAAIGRIALPNIGSGNYKATKFYNSWLGGAVQATGIQPAPLSTVAGVDFSDTMGGVIHCSVYITQGAITAQQITAYLLIDGSGSGSTGLFSETHVSPPMTVNGFMTWNFSFTLDTIPLAAGRHTFGLDLSIGNFGGTGNVFGAADNMRVQNCWMRGIFELV
jgi:hypothetical protein